MKINRFFKSIDQLSEVLALVKGDEKLFLEGREAVWLILCKRTPPPLLDKDCSHIHSLSIGTSKRRSNIIVSKRHEQFQDICL